MSAPQPAPHPRPDRHTHWVAATSRVGHVDLAWRGADSEPRATLHGADADTVRMFGAELDTDFETDRLRLHADRPPADPRPQWELLCANNVLWGLDHRGRDGHFVLEGDNLRLAEALAVVQRGDVTAHFNTTHPDLVALALRTISGGLVLAAGGHFSALQEAVFDVTSGRLHATLDGQFTGLRTLTAHLTSGSGDLVLAGHFLGALDAHLHTHNATLTLDLRGQFQQQSHVFVESKASILTVLLDAALPTRLDIVAQATSYRATHLHWHEGAWYTSTPPHPADMLVVSIIAQSGDLSLMATAAA